MPQFLQYLTEYILFDFFNEKMAYYRSRKPKVGEGEKLIQIITSKSNELKQDLITEIKSLIQLEVKKSGEEAKKWRGIQCKSFENSGADNITGAWKKWFGTV